MFRIALCALIVLTGASSACRKPEAASANKTDTQKPAVPEPVKPIPATLPDVLARVNGEAVTKADFEKWIAQMEMNAGQQIPQERRDEIYRKALDQLVNMKVLAAEAASRGVTGDEKAVEDQMQRIRGQFPSEEQYTKALGARGMTPDKLRAEMLNESRINSMMEAEAKKDLTPVTDVEVRDFYDKNPTEFKQPEQVRASHILFPAKEGDVAAQTKARATATTVLKQAKAGKDFAALAKQHSTDGSAQQGGDLGFFAKDRMVPPFANAAFALKPGQISDIVQTEYGFHIIKVTGRKEAETVPFEKVTEQIREFLTRKRSQERAEALIKQLRSKAKVEVLV